MKSHRSNGFTLIELLISLGISSLLLIVIVSVFLTSVRFQERYHVASEVEQQGAFVLETMLQDIRNAQSITAPAAGGSASSLTLNVVSSVRDPLVFDQLDGFIRIAEGVSTPIELTSSSVTATGLTFSNVSTTGSPGAVRIQFTLSAGTYSQTFYGTGTLRPNE